VLSEIKDAGNRDYIAPWTRDAYPRNAARDRGRADWRMEQVPSKAVDLGT